MIKKKKLIMHVEVTAIEGLGPFIFDKEIICDSSREALVRLNQSHNYFLSISVVNPNLIVDYKIVDYVEENEVCN